MNLIIIFIIFILITFILFKIFKTILKTIFSLSVLIIIVLIILITSIYLDISSLKENFLSSDNLILLKDNSIITGLVFNQGKNLSAPISESELSTINLKNNPYYKTIIFNFGYIEENLQEITPITENISLTKTQIIYILKSETPIEDFRKYTNNQLIITETDRSKFKSQIFTLVFKENTNFNTLIREYKEEHIEIYPKTITFKIIKLIPTIILKNIQ